MILTGLGNGRWIPIQNQQAPRFVQPPEYLLAVATPSVGSVHINSIWSNPQRLNRFVEEYGLVSWRRHSIA
jgi:hypothetical protein